MNEIRQKKIEREIQKTIASLILSDKVKDPRITMATIHRVELSKDMAQATVYYTAYCNNNERKKLSAGLVSASGFFQSQIGKRMALRQTPKLYFVWDNAYIKSLEVNRLIDESAPKDYTAKSSEESDDIPGEPIDQERIDDAEENINSEETSSSSSSV